MRRIGPFLLAALLLVTGCASATKTPGDAAATDAPAAQLPNPVVEVADAAAFAPLALSIDAPRGAQELRYSIISDQIAQVNFTLDGRAYTYRAARTEADISGVYETFDEEAVSINTDSDGGGTEIVIRTVENGVRGALAQWRQADVQYSLYTGDAVDTDAIGALALTLAGATLGQEPPAQTLPEETVKGLEAMQPILDSILRTIGFINGSAFDPSDTEQFWTRLYLMGVNFGGQDARVTHEDGASVVAVPRQVMYEWASAFSETFNGLPDLAPDMGFIRYDAARKVYLLDESDMGDSSTAVERCESDGEGEYLVSLGVYQGDGERIGGMDFRLVANPFLGGSGSTPLIDADDMAPVEQPVFRYTVRAAAAQTTLPAETPQPPEGDFTETTVGRIEINDVDSLTVTGLLHSPAVTVKPSTEDQLALLLLFSGKELSNAIPAVDCDYSIASSDLSLGVDSVGGAVTAVIGGVSGATELSDAELQTLNTILARYDFEPDV